MFQPRHAGYTLATLALVFFALLLFIPLAQLLTMLPQGVREMGAERQEWLYFTQRLIHTVLQGGLAALLCALIGLPAALALWFLPLKAKDFWARLLLLPFLLPVVVVALAMRALFFWLGEPGEVATSGQGDGPWALFAGFVFYNTGMFVWMVWSALQRVPVALIHTAQSLGADYGQVLRFVVWPLLRPACAAALAWVFLFCASSFGLSLILGGPQWATLEVEIYRVAMRELNLPLATLLALVQFLGSAVVVGAALGWEARSKDRAACGVNALALDASKQESRMTAFYRQAPGAWKRAAWFHFVVALALCAVPLLALLLASLYGTQGWTLNGYIGLWRDDSGYFWPALANTLKFVFLSLPLAALLAVATAWLTIYLEQRLLLASAERSCIQGVLRSLVALLAYLPYLVSASMLSLALLLTYPQWTGHLMLLLAAYALLAYPLMTRQLVYAWAARDPQLLAAAQSLGAGPWVTLRHGLWPALSGAWHGALALAAATMLGEFAVTLFLSRPDWMTLSTLIHHWLGKVGAAPIAHAQAAAVLLLILALSVFTLLSLLNYVGRPRTQFSARRQHP